MRCPDRNDSYADCGTCRIYFDSRRNLLEYKITLGEPCE